MNNVNILFRNIKKSEKYLKSTISPLKLYTNRLGINITIFFEEKLFEEKLNKKYNNKYVIIEDKKLILDNYCIEGYVNAIKGNIAYIYLQNGILFPSRCNSKESKKYVSWRKYISFLILHELLHLYGLQHCNTKKCILGKVICNGKIRYCWNCFANKKIKNIIELFCPEHLHEIKTNKSLTFI